MNFYPFELIEIDTVIPSEEVCNDSLEALKIKIVDEDYWTDPIVIDKESRVIMNGNHRFNAAKDLGLHFIPSVVISYESGEVDVREYKRNEIAYDVSKIMETVLNGKLLPIKETRHRFKKEIPKIKVPLSSLKGNEVVFSGVL